MTKTKEVKLVNVTLVTCPSNNTTTLRPSTRESLQASGSQTSSGNRSHAQDQENTITERTAAGSRTLPTQNAVFVTSHGVDWRPQDLRLPLNGPVPRKFWSVSHVTYRLLPMDVPNVTSWNDCFYDKRRTSSSLQAFNNSGWNSPILWSTSSTVTL